MRPRVALADCDVRVYSRLHPEEKRPRSPLRRLKIDLSTGRTRRNCTSFIAGSRRKKSPRITKLPSKFGIRNARTSNTRMIDRISVYRINDALTYIILPTHTHQQLINIHVRKYVHLPAIFDTQRSLFKRKVTDTIPHPGSRFPYGTQMLEQIVHRDLLLTVANKDTVSKKFPRSSKSNTISDDTNEVILHERSVRISVEKRNVSRVIFRLCGIQSTFIRIASADR